jgi:hypothetical protein
LQGHCHARVDIWQCDKDGVYSGYVNQGVNAVGKSWLRSAPTSPMTTSSLMAPALDGVASIPSKSTRQAIKTRPP